MKQLYKGWTLLAVVIGTVLFFGGLVILSDSPKTYQFDASVLVPYANREIQVYEDLGGCWFNNDDIISGYSSSGLEKSEGVYLCRPVSPNANNVYWSSISTENLIENSSFNLDYDKVHALVRQNDEWIRLDKDDHENFWITLDEADSTYHSVKWSLRESAPAALYGVSCSYTVEMSNNEKVEKESIFPVLYTGDWTYINVVDEEGERSISNFWGGSDLTLNLYINYNDGAANPNISANASQITETKVSYGTIQTAKDIVSVSDETMDIMVKTMSGKIYSMDNLEYEFNDKNHLKMRFLENLQNDVYIIQITSDANRRIIGQYIIDNTGAERGVNFSGLWVILMILGGVLTFGASTVYLVPFAIIKINEARVYKEKERVDRIKNPEKYAESDKKSLKGIVGKFIYNLKTPVYKRKEEQAKAEKEKQESEKQNKTYSNRFTEMLRERQEKRDYMREHNVTSEELEKMKEAAAVAAEEEANSFIALRDDDDDEIATFHAAKEEISTLETGSYVKDGVTFAELDSERGKDKK